MKRFICLLALVSVIFLPDSPTIAGPMAGADAQNQFAEWVQEHGGTHIDFEGLAAGTLLDSQVASLGVTFKSIRNPDGTAISKPVVVILSGGSNEISGTPSWGSGSDGRVAYEVTFANPQRWAGLYRHWHNKYTITRFYNPSGQLIYTFQNYEQAPEGFSKIFFGYLVESDDAAHWIGRIECDGDMPAPDNRLVGYADDLYYGTADVSEAPPFMVTSATATIDPQKTDELTILASIRNLTLVNGQSVLFQAGLFADEIPVGKFQQEGQKYTYTGQKGGPGLSKLILDLEQGKATFIAKEILLTGFSNPLPIRLATGEFDQCSMIVFDVEGNLWSFKSAENASFPCVIPDAPELSVMGLYVGKAQNITVSAKIAPYEGLAENSIELVRVDKDLNVMGTPLCSLLDNGNAQNGDQSAGDRVFSCIGGLKAKAPGTINLAVRALVGDMPIFSPAVALEAFNEVTQAKFNETVQAHAKAVGIWKKKASQYGVTREARIKAAREIKKVPGIKDAGLSPDNATIWVDFQSGIEGALLIKSGSGGDPGLARVPTPAARTDTSHPTAMQTPSSADNPPRIVAGSASDSKVGNCKVFVYDPFLDELGKWDVADELKDLFANPDDQEQFKVTYLRDTDCTVAALKNLTDYGTVILGGHGGSTARGDLLVATREVFNKLGKTYKFGVSSRSLARVWYEELDEYYFAFKPNFVTGLSGSFKNSIVYVGTCFSAYNNMFARAFLKKGAKAYFGYSWITDGSVTIPTAKRLFNGLVSQHMNTAEAMASVRRKYGAGPFRGVGKEPVKYSCSKNPYALYKYAAASLETWGDQLWIYADNSTKVEKDVLLGSGHYFPLEGHWTSGNTFTINIDKYKNGNSVYTGKLEITLDLEPGSQEIRGIKLFTFVLAEVYTLPEHGYTSI